MRLTKIGIVVLGLVWAGVAFSQTDVKDIERALKGKQLPLRSFSADAVAHYDWQDGKLTAEEPSLHTLGVFQTRSVKLKGDVVRLIGTRSTLVLEAASGKLARSLEVPMTLEVELHGADPASVLPSLQAGLFFKNLDEAKAGVPVQFRKSVPWRFGRNTSNGKHPQLIERQGNWEEIEADDPKLKLPKPTLTPEPEFSKEARNVRVSGMVVVACVVDDTGRPTQLWLASPLGYGLDEKALAAVRRYVFEPSEYEGQKVFYPMAVEVRFQIN